MDMMKTMAKNSGFTVIEVMIAVCLSGIAFLAATAMLEGTTRRNTMTKHSTLAVWEVADTVESFKSLRFTPRVPSNPAAGISAQVASIPVQLTADGYEGDNGGGALGDSYDLWRSNPRGESGGARTVELSGLPQGRLNWFVEDERNSSEARCKRIGICVSWIGKGGQTVGEEENVKMVYGTLVKTPGI